MKASEVIKLYNRGHRDFRGQNLRGQNFKEETLSGADFSYAKIEGTDFTNANLINAKFIGATAGLERHQAIFLLLMLFLALSGVGFISSVAGIFIPSFFLQASFVHDYLISIYLLGIILLTIFMFVGSRTYKLAINTKHKEKNSYSKFKNDSDKIFRFSIITESFSIILLIISIFLVTIQKIDIAIALTLCAGTSSLLGFFLALGLAGASTVAGPLSGLVVWLGLAIVSGSTAKILIENNILEFYTAIIFVLVSSICIAAIGIVIAKLSLEGDSKLFWIRLVVVNFSCVGGTSFRGADLTDADFTNADLKSIDFREANLTNTCFFNAKGTTKFRQENPEYSILSNPLTLSLLVELKADCRQSYYGANLEGAYLVGASLEGADLSRANLSHANLQDANLEGARLLQANLNEAQLQNANLEGAKLVQAQLDGADMRGATLTAAYIEKWNITTATKLDAIKCDYVYMRLPKSDGRPSFLPPAEVTSEDNRRRHPQEQDKKFEDGDFADFIKPLQETLDLYHNQSIDPRLVAIAFTKLDEDNPQAQLELVAIEKRGKSKDKLLMRVETRPQADHSALAAEYSNNLTFLQSLTPELLQALQAQLDEKDKTIKLLASLIESKHPSLGVVISPNFNSTQNQRGPVMSNDSKNFSISGDSNRVAQGDNSLSVLGDNTQAVQGDNNQVSQGATETAKEPINKDDALALMRELEKLIQDSELPEKTKEEVLTYLKTTKMAVDKPEPKKDLARINLEEMTKVIQDATGTVVASKTLWTTAKPIILKIASWLGAVAAGSFLAGL